MLYDYLCKECGHKVVDHYQSIHDDPITLCPECNLNTLERIITGGMACFVKDVKTIGQLADKNLSKLGSYKRSELVDKNKKEKSNSTSYFSKFGNATRQQINNMTPEQTKKYIITGEQ
jgi:putative FmdB family regulatory protein